MRVVLFILLFCVATTAPSYAQEEEGAASYGHAVQMTQTSEAVERSLARVLEATALYLYEESRASMVAPRLCLRREIQIPREVPHPRAGMILRIERGECLLESAYYVHNPATHRIYIIEETEAIAILESIVTLMQQHSASE
jgi:hypothetical protein